MALLADLQARVKEYVDDPWGQIPTAYVVPSAEDLTFGNTGKYMDVCVLYADIHGSTDMVDSLTDVLAAEYYKAFLHCAAKIIRSEQGVIEAYDGDRVMAIFHGDGYADRAVFAALGINYAVETIINPTFLAKYAALHRVLKHTVGVDCGKVLIAKTGVRVDSDLVWVGPAANYAAKLNSFIGLDAAYPTRISAAVFSKLTDAALYGANRASVWQGPYSNFPNQQHFRSGFHRTIL
jgi:class 3 adenylate cyclase